MLALSTGLSGAPHKSTTSASAAPGDAALCVNNSTAAPLLLATCSVSIISRVEPE